MVLLTLAASLLVLTASCGSDPEGAATPVADSSVTTGAPSTLAAGGEGSAVPGSATPSNPTSTTTIPTTTLPEIAVADTVPVADRLYPVLPPVTAPPSELLTEVTAAYDEAMLAYDRASASPSGDLPDLPDYICCAHLPRIRARLLSDRLNGVISTTDPSRRWRRIEAITQLAPDDVDLDVCRDSQAVETDLVTGQVTRYPARMYRFIDSMRLIDGRWKWWAREWVDPSPDYTDCSPPP